MLYGRLTMKACLLALLSACAIELPDDIHVDPPESEVPEDPSSTTPPTIIYVGPRDQGQYLLGEMADTIAASTAYHAYTNETPVARPNAPAAARVRAMGSGLSAYSATGQLLFSGAHNAFVGLELGVVGPPSTRVRITGVGTSPEARPLYFLDLIVNNAVTPFCGGNGAVFASPGKWTRTGTHEAGPNITFSCYEHGVIAKCEGWGYPSGTASNGLPGSQDPWMVHQACTRMARADRCGNGVSRTFDGTSILIRDAVAGAEPNITDEPLENPVADPPPYNVFYLEAGWDAKGVVCMSRSRWKGLPLSTDECAHIIDPRKGAGTFCEDLDQAQLADLMFQNASRIGQLYLNVWKNGGEYTTTVRGTGSSDPAKVVPPFSGYTFVNEIGLVLMNPPTSIVALTPVDLYRHAGTGERVVAPAAPTANHAVVGFEGHLHQLQNPTNTRIAIRIFRNPANGDHLAADVAPAAGWVDLGPIGYVEPRP